MRRRRGWVIPRSWIWVLWRRQRWPGARRIVNKVAARPPFDEFVLALGNASPALAKKRPAGKAARVSKQQAGAPERLVIDHTGKNVRRRHRLRLPLVVEGAAGIASHPAGGREGLPPPGDQHRHQLGRHRAAIDADPAGPARSGCIERPSPFSSNCSVWAAAWHPVPPLPTTAISGAWPRLPGTGT